MLRNTNNIKEDFSQSFTPFQIEFLSEDEPISITPNFRMEELHFLSGTYGPFTPALPLQVPLWLAISLKKKKKCKIQYPAWLTIQSLKDRYDQENEVETSFEKMPAYFIEIATMLLSNAPDDCPENVNNIRGYLEDIINRRQEKLSDTIIQTLKPMNTIDALRISNISMMEINKIRPTITTGFNHLDKISQVENLNINDSQTTTSSSFS